MVGTAKETAQGKAKGNRSQAIGGVFLMAASAMGPGFLTQTAKFVNDFHGSFGFVILASLILSLIVQVNVWRVLCVSGMRAQDVANKILPGLGYLLAVLVFAGGLIFNISNVGGAALGLNALFGLDLHFGYLAAGAVAIVIFSVKNAQRAVDNMAKILSVVKICIILIVMIIVQPPVGLALKESVMPSVAVPELFPSILTLVGGTVGGYITFAGAHRLIDGGVVGRQNEKQIVRSAASGLGIASFSRFFLFLLVLGVVWQGGVSLDPDNPAADAFLLGGGMFCYRLFGLLLFSAGITSIIGASYTSLSFVKSLNKNIAKHDKALTLAFITCSMLVMLLLGKPATLLVVAGALNALVLPLALVISLIAAYRKDIVGEAYHHPMWLTVTGVVSAVLFAYFAINGLGSLF